MKYELYVELNNSAVLFGQMLDQFIGNQQGDHPRIGETYKFFGALLIAKAILLGCQLVVAEIGWMGEHLGECMPSGD